ncbi:MAG: HpcH/HpaI aldolase/citrate lyase family protein [Pyramidobacter sp.]|jgi:citrate lyase subunit beta/citryl-CoA lyase
MRRSMLFLPGNTPNIIVNGDALGADNVILDLEDAVAPDQKDAARILVRNAIKSLGFENVELTVRINSLDTPYWQADLEEIVPLRPDLIMPTKVGSADDVKTLDAFMAQVERRCGLPAGTVKLIPLIETARGLENAYAVASASPRVAALFLGAEDLTADLRAPRSKEGTEILYARCRMVSAARAAGVDVYDTPFTDVNDDEGAAKDAQFARSLGFSGKAAISPRHVRAINEAFSPTKKEIDYAREVLAAIRQAKEQGRGAISLYGKMIDKPIVTRAQQTLAMAEALQGGRKE